MNICVLPIDNRPVCYSLLLDIVNCAKEHSLSLPARNLLGGLTSKSNIDGLYDYLQNIKNTDTLVLSMDTIAYGGLVASRRDPIEYETIIKNLSKFKEIFQEKFNKIHACSSIMRISNNNINIEEKEYWSKYGKKIFDYSFHTSKAGKWGMESCVAKLIPDEILNDYMATRRRNFEINKHYLEWEKEGIFDTLIFSKDDCAEYGFNVDEAKELQRLGGTTITGADEIPLTLLAKALNKKISICPVFTEESEKHLISKYEDISVEESVIKQAKLAGFEIKSYKDADIILIVNNFKSEQGEIVMKVNTSPFQGDIKKYLPKDKPYIIADVRFANGSDNAFVEQLFSHGRDEKFLGYAAWNTTANTVGSLLCMTKYIYNAEQLDNVAYNKLLATRFLDDWAYQANIRQTLLEPSPINKEIEPYVAKIEDFLGIKIKKSSFNYPWNRLFEIEVDIDVELLNGVN